jgi:hypothetical protein
MTDLLETPINPYFLLDEVDVIFDNTPLSAEDQELMAQMIAKLKLEDQTPSAKIIPADEDLYLHNTPQSDSDKGLVDAHIKKSKAQIRRRELYAARKAQKAVYTEGG